MNNKKPFDFMNILEEKGIISSSSNKSSNSQTKRPKPQTLGSLFKDIVKELTEDPERRTPTYGTPPEVDNDNYKDYDLDLEDDTISALEPKDAKTQKKEAAQRHKVEILRQEATIAAKKKRDAELAQQELDKEYALLKKEEQAIKDRLQSMREYSKLLHNNKSSLRQAFVFTEILSKPVSLR